MDVEAKKRALEFGASPAGLILLIVLASYFLDDWAIASVLESPPIAKWLALGERSEVEIRATKRALIAIVSPCIMFGITLGLLKMYLHRLKVSEIFGSFGVYFWPHPKTLILWSVTGVLLVLGFSQGLATIFPPPEFVAPHPGNVVNFGTTLDKLLFVISAVVLAPIAEEFLFRGVLYRGFSNAWNKPTAAIFVTVCFILIHPETYATGYWLTHAFLITVSCALMTVRELTGGVIPCITLHAGINLTILFT